MMSVLRKVLSAIFLIALALLGDNKQFVGDVLIAVVAVVFYLGFQKNISRQPAVPRPIVTLWFFATVVTIASFFWSDSGGASIQAGIRYCLGWLFFMLAFDFGDNQRSEDIQWGVCVATIGLSLLSLLFLFTNTPTWLPSMNIISLSFGHSHVADLILLAVPSLFYQQGIYWVLGVGVVCVSLVLSLARGAWGIFLIYFVVVKKHICIIQQIVPILFIILLAGLSLLVGSHVSPTIQARAKMVIQRLHLKPNLMQDSRVEYWKQAIYSIKERPITGSGAGTFYIASRRLQSRPGAYSWFAHSFLLQTVSELGLLSLPVVVLFLWSGYQCVVALRNTRTRKEDRGIALGALLIFMYSFIDFSLNFVLMWCLYWLAIGRVAQLNYVNKKGERSVLIRVPIVVLLIYYVLVVLSNSTLAFFPNQANIAFYFSPFDATAARNVLNRGTYSAFDERMLYAFHARDVDVLESLARAQEKKGKTTEAIHTYAQMISIDPVTEKNHEKYISLLLSESRFADISKWFGTYAQLFFPAHAQRSRVPAISPDFFSDRSTKTLDIFNPGYSHEVRYGKILYAAGRWYLDKNPSLTRDLWSASGQLLYNLSYIWLERAALEEYMFHDQNAANNLIDKCLNVPSAAPHCRQAGFTLVPPGRYAVAIDP